MSPSPCLPCARRGEEQRFAQTSRGRFTAMFLRREAVTLGQILQSQRHAGQRHSRTDDTPCCPGTWPTHRGAYPVPGRVPGTVRGTETARAPRGQASRGATDTHHAQHVARLWHPWLSLHPKEGPDPPDSEGRSLSREETSRTSNASRMRLWVLISLVVKTLTLTTCGSRPNRLPFLFLNFD